jgi:hypothetical protein
LSFQSHGQVALEKNYPLEDLRYFYITDTQGVYVNYSSYSDIRAIRLFNDQQEQIKIINALDDTILNVINVSKYLCNDDDLYEIIYTYHTFQNGVSHYNTHVINENSALLFSRMDQYLWIQNTADGAKLISQQGSKVYSLPGINYPLKKGDKGDPGPMGPEGPMGPQGPKGDPVEANTASLNPECDCQVSSINLPVNESIFLSEPFPNPANASCNITYDIASVAVPVKLVVYDLVGNQRMNVQLQPPGGAVEIHGSLLGSGTYFLRLEYESGSSQIRKLVFE